MGGAAPRDGDAVEAAAARFGVAVEVKPPQPFAVWPENQAVFNVFCASATQWRTGGMSGHPTGLDYTAVRQVAFALRAQWTAPFLSDLQVMESAALKVWADQRRREGSREAGRTTAKGKGRR